MSLRSLDDIQELIAFFEARQGQMHGFRWKDWADYSSCRASGEVGFEDQLIGVGDGATVEFGLVKAYRSGPAEEVRRIGKPVAGSVRVGLMGDEVLEGVQFTLDDTTGVVRFATPPAVGERVTAGFEFDVPVRFDTDRIQVSVASFQAGDVPHVPVVEVRL